MDEPPTLRTSAPATVPPVAALWLRVAGGLVDLFLTWFFSLLFAAVAGLGSSGPGLDPSAVGFQCSQQVEGGQFGIALAPVFLVFALMEWRWGWTPGKRLVGTRVVRTDGSALTLGPALLRNALRYVDFACLYGFGLAIAALTRRNQRVGDVVARTLVVDIRPGAQAQVPSGATRSLRVGCGLLGVLITLVLLALLGVRAWDRWQVDGYGENVDQAGWQEPADGVLLEPRLEAFVQIRREIHEHYSRDLAGLSPGQVFRMLLRPYVLRRAEAAAQARVGMGDREYFWTMVTVIRALGAPASRPGGSGGPPHLVVATAQLQTEAAFRAARIDEEERARWKALWDSDEAPPENVELVGRYREEIARLAVPPALLVVE